MPVVQARPIRIPDFGPKKVQNGFPDGPTARYPLQFLVEVARNPLAMMISIARGYGDISHYKIGPQHIYFFNHPDLIRDVLVTHQKNFHKSRGLERAKRLLGNGLLTSEDEFHLRQRRLAQPAFHRQRIASYATTMVESADRTRSSWTDGATVDVPDVRLIRLSAPEARRTVNAHMRGGGPTDVFSTDL